MLFSWRRGRLLRLFRFLFFSAAIVAVASLAHVCLLLTPGFGPAESYSCLRRPAASISQISIIPALQGGQLSTSQVIGMWMSFAGSWFLRSWETNRYWWTLGGEVSWRNRAPAGV
jgi:hypothetical protein